MFDRRTVQRRSDGSAAAPEAQAPGKVTQIAEQGVAGASAPLPYLDELKTSFGRHGDALDGARAQIGGPATDASAALGAHGYATGDRVAFADTPDRALVAHEAAHVVQQRGGVSLSSGISAASDDHEQHADQVAAAFVAGRSAESLFDRHAGGDGGQVVQRKAAAEGAPPMSLEVVQDLWKKSGQVLELGSTIGELGEKLELLARWKRGDHITLEGAKRVQAVAKGVIDVWKGCQELLGEVSGATNTAEKVVKEIGKVLDAVEAITNVMDQKPLYDFLHDPTSYDKAKVWAEHTSSIFTTAAGFIPDEIPGIPKFITQMLKGLLSAPANYVAAFTNIMDGYQRTVTEKSGFEAEPNASFGSDIHHEWEGSLARFYRSAPPGLQEFMRAQHERDGSLWKADAMTACSVLVRALEQEGSEEHARWIGLINAYLARVNQEDSERIAATSA